MPDLQPKDIAALDQALAVFESMVDEMIEEALSMEGGRMEVIGKVNALFVASIPEGIAKTMAAIAIVRLAGESANA